MSDVYTATPSVISGPARYRVDGDALVVERLKNGARERVKLADVVSVRLGLTQGLAVCELRTSTGEKLVVPSGYVPNVSALGAQYEAYAAFVRRLHEVLARVAPNARYVAGSDLGFALGAMVLVLTGAFFALFPFVMLSPGRHAAKDLLPLVGIVPAGLVAFAMMRRGRAKTYAPSAPPDAYLPAGR